MDADIQKRDEQTEAVIGTAMAVPDDLNIKETSAQPTARPNFEPAICTGALLNSNFDRSLRLCRDFLEKFAALTASPVMLLFSKSVCGT